MPSVIRSIESGSPADKTKIRPGDTLLKVNGKEIRDVLDYKYFTYEKKLVLELSAPGGRPKRVRVAKGEGEPLGLEFETYLMDKARSCSNRCIFCFVDQMPRGMRRTLYFKDDDMRLSFLMGNYITLTNLSDREARRIIDLRISPINVSVHSTDPELRSTLLGNPEGGKGIELMRRFAENGITMNCQIVCCPGYNDGAQLQRSMEDLADMYPGVNSVSIVPVGLTKYREKLTPLQPFDREIAGRTIAQVEKFGAGCLDRFGTRIFFCADEMYLKAGLDIPENDFYEEYAQLENGVGMLRLLETEFESELSSAGEFLSRPFSVATGVAAGPFMERLLEKAAGRFPGLDGRVFPIVNDFFGKTIDVSGLVTGGDLIKQLRGKPLGERLLIPETMLRHGEGVFLDDVTIEEIEKELGVKAEAVRQDGGCLLRAMLGTEKI